MPRFNRGAAFDSGSDRELLLQYLLGDLPGEATDVLEGRLMAEPPLREELARLRRVHSYVSESRATSFGPYFKERVIRRMQPDPANGAEALYDSLRSIFARAAIACLLAAAALGSLNVVAYGTTEVASSLTEAVFGLPSATLMDALDYDVL